MLKNLSQLTRRYQAVLSSHQQTNIITNRNMHKCCSQASTTLTTSSSSLSSPPRSKCVLALSNGSNSSKTMSTHHTPYPISADTCARIEERQSKAYEFFAHTLELYSVDQLIFCFNGGKDCTVLLDLLMRWCRLRGIDSREIPMLYIQSDDSFDEIDEFVANSVARYNVQLIEYKDSLKEALTHMAADMPSIKAVFVGSRNTDPYCEHLSPMQPTDNGWPPMMRLNPLLEWSYHDVWHYIHIHNVPYCSLYEQGYTSIGYKSNTVPNPHLKSIVSDIASNCCTSSNRVCQNEQNGHAAVYRPAWELDDPTLERAGRLAKK